MQIKIQKIYLVQSQKCFDKTNEPGRHFGSFLHKGKSSCVWSGSTRVIPARKVRIIHKERCFLCFPRRKGSARRTCQTSRGSPSFRGQGWVKRTKQKAVRSRADNQENHFPLRYGVRIYHDTRQHVPGQPERENR